MLPGLTQVNNNNNNQNSMIASLAAAMSVPQNLGGFGPSMFNSGGSNNQQAMALAAQMLVLQQNMQVCE